MPQELLWRLLNAAVKYNQCREFTAPATG